MIADIKRRIKHYENLIQILKIKIKETKDKTDINYMAGRIWEMSKAINYLKDLIKKLEG